MRVSKKSAILVQNQPSKIENAKRLIMSEQNQVVEEVPGPGASARLPSSCVVGTVLVYLNCSPATGLVSKDMGKKTRVSL